MSALVAISLGLLFFTVGMIGFALAVLGLPGTWLILLTGVGVELLRPGTFSMWTIGVGAALVIGAEIAEFSASAVGAKRAGGSRRSLVLAIVGGMVGAIAGTILLPVPVIGTLAGAAIGAGACALVAELSVEGMTFAQAGRVGRGAAIGRTLATVIKGAFALALTALLIVAAVV